MPQDTQNTPQEETQTEHPKKAKTLLIVVIIQGVLLLGGFAVVVGTIIKRLNNPASVAATIKAKNGFGEVVVRVPLGAKLVGTQTTADRLVLRLTDHAGDMLLLMDVRKGVELGRIRLKAGD